RRPAPPMRTRPPGRGRRARVQRDRCGTSGGLQAGEPERDLPGRGLLGVRAVAEVELGLEAEVPADGTGGGLLHGVGPAGELTPGGDGPRPPEDARDDRTGGDELE